METRVGRRIHQYVLLERIGEGGMAEVWRAHDDDSGRVAALKLVKSEGKVHVARLVREARLARRVRHPHVVEVRELLRSGDGLVALALEHLQGTTLDALIARHGALPPPFVASIGAALAAGLVAVHEQGIVHRDVKPSNVFLADSGGGMVPKLLDFGIAERAGRCASEIAGTPGYMAPEQTQSALADPRSDVWALGVLLFEAFAGRRLFDGELAHVMQQTLEGRIPRLHDAALGVPALFADVVAAMLERDPARRIADLRYVHSALAALAPTVELRSVA